MKRVCMLLALLLLLTGCGQGEGAPQLAPETESHLINVDIYAVNDLHGKLADTNSQPGVDELSTYLENAGAAGHTLLLSTGDMWQGAAESNLTGGLIVTEWMNELGFAAMTLGGHEYDWGEDQIRQNDAAADFPFLGINIYNRATNQRVNYCQSSVMVDVEGVQIGIIGAIGNCYYSIASENTQDVYFKVGNELTALVKEESKKLRDAGADCIIYTIHDGYEKSLPAGSTVPDEQLHEYYDASLSEGYVDIVFEADSHYTYAFTDRHGVYHLQAGGNNTGISHATVQIDPSTDAVAVVMAETVPSATYGTGEDAPVVEQLLDKYAGQISDANRVLGTNKWYRGGDVLCGIVANLYSTKGVERWGAQYDIVLGGGYISCRSPGHLPIGEVRYSQLVSLLPFDNPITLCSIQGRDLIDRFIENDHYAYYIHTTDYGNSILDNIDPDGVYYVVTDTYTANYTYNRMTVVDTYAEDVFARDLLADYITEGGLDR